jgi:hypothetical protein
LWRWGRIVSAEQIVSDRLIATVETEDKRTRKPVQLRSGDRCGVSLRDLAVFVQEALFLEELSGLFRGSSILQAELRHGGLEFSQLLLAHDGLSEARFPVELQ